MIADLLHSCSNAQVARAAVRCVGGGFAERVAMAADRQGMEVGRFVSSVVCEFQHHASLDAFDALGRRMAASELPLLEGLTHVVETALAEDVSHLAPATGDPRLGGVLSASRQCDANVPA